MKRISNSIGSIVLLVLLIAVVAARSQAQSEQSKRLVVPAGTEIVVRLIDALDSTRSAVGEITRASIDQPVVVEDFVAIKKGSDAAITLVRSQNGKDNFIKLQSVTIRGKAYRTSASYAEVKAGTSGGKIAKRGIGLGVLGATIGAIAGGGKGAAIGAASGGGLGVISGAASGGGSVKLPSETLLRFELRADIALD